MLLKIKNSINLKPGYQIRVYLFVKKIISEKRNYIFLDKSMGSKKATQLDHLFAFYLFGIATLF
jgi:hypothetical protein